MEDNNTYLYGYPPNKVISLGDVVTYNGKQGKVTSLVGGVVTISYDDGSTDTVNSSSSQNTPPGRRVASITLYTFSDITKPGYSGGRRRSRTNRKNRKASRKNRRTNRKRTNRKRSNRNRK